LSPERRNMQKEARLKQPGFSSLCMHYIGARVDIAD
jgi:hypothetical protein